MTYKIAQTLAIGGEPDYQQVLRQAGLDVNLVKKMCRTEDDIISFACDADAIIGAGSVEMNVFSERVMEGLEKCRFIMSLGIGYDSIDVDAATERGILVANVPNSSINEVSDHAMALILDCAKQVTLLNNMVKDGQWESKLDLKFVKMSPQMIRLRGKTLGIIGLGRIGRALVPKAKGFGLRVIADDPYVPQEIFDELEVERVDLDGVLAESDIISLHTLLNKETEHLLGPEQFKKMKPSVILVNTSRGKVIDSEAFYDALVQGRISKAAIDVTDPEPLPKDSPLLKMDNFIITPHAAAFTPDAFGELFRRPGEEMIRVFKGEMACGIA